MAKPTISYAQRFEDLYLMRCFGGRSDGFYTDIGSGHPVYDNASFAFYLEGWHGVTVEPNPTLARLSRAIRPLPDRAAAWSTMPSMPITGSGASAARSVSSTSAQACAEARKPWGIVPRGPEYATRMRGWGCQMFVTAFDIHMIHGGIRAMKARYGESFFPEGSA